MATILIVEDVEYMANAIKGCLLAKSELGRTEHEIVNMVKSPDDMFDFARGYHRAIDIIVLDTVYRAGETHPVLTECTKALEKLSADKQNNESCQYPSLKNSKVILLSHNERLKKILPDAWPHISSCVDKDNLTTELSKAVRILSDGDADTLYFNKYAALKREIIQASNKQNTLAFWEKLLKEQQRKVLEGLLKGHAPQQIANDCNINMPNVTMRKKEIFNKLAELSARQAAYRDQAASTWAIINLCLEFRHPLALEMVTNNGINLIEP